MTKKWQKKNDILNVGKGLGHMHQHFSIYITGRSPNRTIFLKGNLKKNMEMFSKYIYPVSQQFYP